MNTQEKLLAKRRAIELELERLLGEDDSLLFRAMRYAVFSGGKRFRPLLVLSSGECFRALAEILLPFACALELIHNYSLIHDDLPVMDNDDYRRGKPSCHKAFGEDIALLAGDGLLSLAFEVLAEARVPADLYPKKEEVVREISHAAGGRGMIAGQILDITCAPGRLTEREIDDLVLKKTGALIVAAVKTGAILGHASRPELLAAEGFGMNIGLAFQVRDDLLDSSDEAKRPSSPRPDYVSLLGIDGAQKRLRQFVDNALKALDAASLPAEELRTLALMLLRLDKAN